MDHTHTFPQLQNIKALALDCDGVLTNGQIFFSADSWRRFFSIKDGLGLKRLQEHGFKVAIITQSKAEDIRKRAESLNINALYEGVTMKIDAFNDFLKKNNITAQQCAYMGDDFPDIEVMRLCGFAATVPNAEAPVKEVADFTTKANGGDGAVREVCELLITSQS